MADGPDDKAALDAARALAQGLLGRGDASLREGKPELAARLAVRARDALTDAGDPASACAAALLEARAWLQAGDLQMALAAARWAEAEARGHALEERLLAARTELGALLEVAGDLDAALAAHKQVLAAHRGRGDVLGTAVAEGNVGRLLQRKDDTTAARTHLEGSLAGFEAVGHKPGMGQALVCLADLDRRSGQMTQARDRLRACLDVAQAANLAPLRAMTWLNLGHTERDLGDEAAARTAFERAFDAAGEIGDAQLQARSRMGLAMLEADGGRVEAAQQAFAEAERRFADLGMLDGKLAAAVNGAALLCRAGWLTEGHARLESAHAALTEMGDENGRREVSLALAEVLLSMGQPRLAWSHMCNEPDEVLGPRLALRRRLLAARFAIRSLDLDTAREALPVLSVVPDPDADAARGLTPGDGFTARLALAELASLSGAPDATERIEALVAHADPERSPREHYAARLVRSGHAHWHGLADQDADAWAAEQGFAHLGEVLPQMQASYLRLRGQLIAGEQRPAFLLDEARAGPLATLADRGALDTARIGRVLERIARRVIALARGADVDDEDGLEEQLWALRAGGNLLAWATLEALAAAALDDDERRASAREVLESTDASVPPWLDRAGEDPARG